MLFPDANFPVLQHQVPTHPSRNPPWSEPTGTAGATKQKSPADGQAPSEYQQCRESSINDVATYHNGAAQGNRTLDLLITSEMLCRLS
jgi:hypothetical protein